MRKMLATVLAVATIGLAACGSDESSDTTAPNQSTTTVPASPGTIVEVAQDDAQFTTLVSAITAAGLVDTLSGTGPFTVFAPTNAAFDALPAGVLTKLLLPANKAILVKILTYHVLASKVMAADVTAGNATTVEGSTFAITTTGGVKVNDANVTATDIAASNGVIHVIDKVLVPPTVDLNSL